MNYEKPLKIVLFGPESTGKTFLAQFLAEHFNTVWVPEYARLYLESKKSYYDFYSKGSEEVCTQEDILPIVLGQMALEDNLLKFAKNFIFFDTNPLQTKVYVNYYYEAEYKWLLKVLDERKYDFYFLTDVDIPWYEDDLRDRPADRHHMFELFQRELAQRGLPYFIISGSFEERKKKAIELVMDFKSK